MRESPMIRPPPKGFGLQLLLVILLVALALGGIYFGSFISHFLWALISSERVHAADGSPAWLVIPSFTIGFGLFFLVARWFRLFERLVKACQRK